MASARVFPHMEQCIANSGSGLQTDAAISLVAANCIFGFIMLIGRVFQLSASISNRAV